MPSPRAPTPPSRPGPAPAAPLRPSTMGNVCSLWKRGANDEENNVAMSLADAASRGAREAVKDAIRKAQHGGDREIVPAVTLIAGVAPVADVVDAAADGAKQAIDDAARELNIGTRFAHALKVVKFAAGSGAKEGLKAADVMLEGDIEGHAEMVMPLELAAAAAGTGAWIACLVSAQTNLTPTPNASKYTALLGPMLGGSMPTSAAIYGLLHASSDFVKLCAFGGITLGVFIVSSGLASGLFGTTPASARYTRLATITAFGIVLVFFSTVICTMFHSPWYKGICGTTCGVLIVIILFCLLSGW